MTLLSGSQPEPPALWDPGSLVMEEAGQLLGGATWKCWLESGLTVTVAVGRFCTLSKDLIAEKVSLLSCRCLLSIIQICVRVCFLLEANTLFLLCKTMSRYPEKHS